MRKNVYEKGFKLTVELNVQICQPYELPVVTMQYTASFEM